MLNNFKAKLKNKMKNQEGFTLIELIVVIAILGILAMLIMPNIMGFTKDANKAVAGQQFKVLDQAYMAQRALGHNLASADVLKLDTTTADAESAPGDTAVKPLTAALGTSVTSIRATAITANKERTALVSAVIQIKGDKYTCKSNEDGTVEVVPVVVKP